MTSAEIRQSFLDFFNSKQHTLVPSSSLMPDAPNLLFTNAGMNQFVPIFLGQRKADVSRWPGAVPGLDTRAADTQKCIRAGGKHNDLEDVGLDTYHHTFFEMLGNWSFGDYFKKEAIEWAWELITGVWRFPRERLYATVYAPDKSRGDPSEFDQEAYDHWARLFAAAGMDPKLHVVSGSKSDNFWMMGDTGPCGPCSEIHVDLTPAGDTRGALVNRGDARCIEIWNLVFIQYNANPDGTFTPLPARHVDTGMGFERVTSLIQGTRGFRDFANARISNYETDVFRPLFDELERLSGKKYGSTLPTGQGTGTGTPFPTSNIEHPTSNIQRPRSDGGGAAGGGSGSLRSDTQVEIDIAFRVLADHIRTLAFAIADGILPGNNDRNYVLRRILRRGVRYGRTLGFHEPFFHKLVDVLAATMGGVFPEIREKRDHVKDVIRSEEEAFNKTLDRGMDLFEECVRLVGAFPILLDELRPLSRDLRSVIIENPDSVPPSAIDLAENISARVKRIDGELLLKSRLSDEIRMAMSASKLPRCLKELETRAPQNPNATKAAWDEIREALGSIDRGLSSIEARRPDAIPPTVAFLLYDTYGFPLDLTELMARERGLSVDKSGFERLMEEQRELSKSAQRKEVVELAMSYPPTHFVGYDQLQAECRVLDFVQKTRKGGGEDHFAVVDVSPLYAEMGGQVGDTGELQLLGRGDTIKCVDTLNVGGAVYLKLDSAQFSTVQWTKGGAWVEVRGEPARLRVDVPRRQAIQRHHTVTHLLHWALHEVVSRDAAQKGSYVGPEKLTFDFNSPSLSPRQVADVERLVNERILENAGVSWVEVPYAEVKSRRDVMQFFGDKYGETVRVVQVGGQAGRLDGYSMELCGGTHTRATGEIGLFRIVAESAIAAGVRRIEAVAGLEAYRRAGEELHLIKALAGRVNSPVTELEKKIESLMAHQKELEKQVKIAQQRNASNAASELLGRAQSVHDLPLITHNLGDADGDFLQAIADALKGRFQGVVVLGGCANDAVVLVATVSPEFTSRVQAGKIIQQIAPLVGGKGGGRPDNARGGGRDASRLDEALAKVKSLVG